MARVAPRGHVGFVHDLLGEGLAAFEPGGLARGAEHEQPVLGEEVGDAGDQRDLGSDDGQVDLLAPGEREQAGEVVGLDGDRVGFLADAGVAGRAEHLGGQRRSTEGMDEGVFATAAADYQNAHVASSPCRDALPGPAGAAGGRWRA